MSLVKARNMTPLVKARDMTSLVKARRHYVEIRNMSLVKARDMTSFGRDYDHVTCQGQRHDVTCKGKMSLVEKTLRCCRCYHGI